MAETDSPPGLVVLVGAGAGQADLLTAAAARWLSRAHVVVHDRLVDPSLLRACRHDAEKIYVGKTPGGAGPDQQWINELLVRRGRAGQTVVPPKLYFRGMPPAFSLGQSQNWSPAAKKAQTAIDEFVIFSRALTPEEILRERDRAGVP